MHKIIFLCCMLFYAIAVFAGDAGQENSDCQKSWASQWWSNITVTWNSDKIEGMLPVNTWHNRWVYDSRVHTYNERPWGAGIAKYRIDEDKIRHRLIAMVFQDSHNKPEPTFAYSWQHLFRFNKTIRPTLGFVTGITFRDDYNWLPIPAILPVVGLDIGNFSIENTYIPGYNNNGNVLFTWISWRF